MSVFLDLSLYVSILSLKAQSVKPFLKARCIFYFSSFSAGGLSECIMQGQFWKTKHREERGLAAKTPKRRAPVGGMGGVH